MNRPNTYLPYVAWAGWDCSKIKTSAKPSKLSWSNGRIWRLGGGLGIADPDDRIVDHELNGEIVERKLIRQDPSKPGVSEFILTAAEYDRLVADGHDPAAVSEMELAQYAKIIRDYDEQGRLIQEVAMRKPEAVVLKYPQTNPEFDPEADA